MNYIILPIILYICILFCICLMFISYLYRPIDKVFFDLGVHNNAKIVLHKPTVIKVYEFKHKFSHYITTLDINNTAYVFYRELDLDLDGEVQKTKLITSKDGLNFSQPITVFNTMPQAHNFAPFIHENNLMSIGGGYNGDMKLYKSIDKGLSWSYVKTIMRDGYFDSINLIVDKNLYGRQWGKNREVHLYRNKGDWSFDKGKKIEVGLTDLYTSGIFKYSNWFVGFPMLFQGENKPSFTKVIYSKDGIKFNHFEDVWFSDPNTNAARSAYVAPGIFKKDAWFMYGLRDYTKESIHMVALKLRPYGLTSIYSENGWIEPNMRCQTCFANIKGLYNGVYVDSLDMEIDCQRIYLHKTHIFRLYC